MNYSGFVNGETSAVLGGTLGYGGTSQGAVDVGSYVITPGGLTSPNYAITYADGTLTVNKAALTGFYPTSHYKPPGCIGPILLVPDVDPRCRVVVVTLTMLVPPLAEQIVALGIRSILWP